MGAKHNDDWVWRGRWSVGRMGRWIDIGERGKVFCVWELRMKKGVRVETRCSMSVSFGTFGKMGGSCGL